MSYLISNYSIDDISITKPKKTGEFLVGRIYHLKNEPVIIQFPKMKLIKEISEDDSFVELEFVNNKKSSYNDSAFNFLLTLDSKIVEYSQNNTTEWFGKNIPADVLKKMYNNFIKAPKDTSSNCTVQFKVKIKELVLTKTRNKEALLSEFKKDSLVECLGRMKYLLFTKDTYHVIWELMGMKLDSRIKRVQKYGFVEDSTESDSNEEIIQDYSFF